MSRARNDDLNGFAANARLLDLPGSGHLWGAVGLSRFVMELRRQ